MDKVDAMIRARASRALLWNGAAPVALGIFSWMCDPFFVFTVLTVIAFAATVTVPRTMRRRLEEPQLFPEWAAQTGIGMGALGLGLVAARHAVAWLL